MSGSTLTLPASQPVDNASVPPEGPRVVPFTVDFSVSNTQTVNLLLSMRAGQLTRVQSIFVDNSANANVVLITTNSTGASISVPPKSQGYFPIAVTASGTITFTSTGSAALVPVQLYNTAMPANVWSVAGGGQASYDASGAMIVSDPTLDGAVASGFMQSQAYGVAAGGRVIPRLIGSRAFHASIAAGQTNVVILTGAPSFFITGIIIQLGCDATVPGTVPAPYVDVALNDGANTVYSTRSYIATGTNEFGPTGTTPLLTATGLEYVSPNNASGLTLNISQALSAGQYYVTIFGGMTPLINV